LNASASLKAANDSVPLPLINTIELHDAIHYNIIGRVQFYGHNKISMLWGTMAYCVKWEIGKLLFLSFV